MSRYGNAKKLFPIIRAPHEKFTGLEGGFQQDIKQAPMKRLNEYVNPILSDIDPLNEIEEVYKSKNKQVFCWRFLRAISYIDQNNFHKKVGTKQFYFNGNVEQLAQWIHEQAKRKEVKPEAEPEPLHEIQGG